MSKKEQLKEIFVVDGDLRIAPVKIPESVWKHKVKVFAAQIEQIDSPPIVIRRGGWCKFTTYAGFETEQQARDFKRVVTAVRKYERRRRLIGKKREEERKTRLGFSSHLHRWRN